MRRRQAVTMRADGQWGGGARGRTAALEALRRTVGGGDERVRLLGSVTAGEGGRRRGAAAGDARGGSAPRNVARRRRRRRQARRTSGLTDASAPAAGGDLRAPGRARRRTIARRGRRPARQAVLLRRHLPMLETSDTVTRARPSPTPPVPRDAATPVWTSGGARSVGEQTGSVGYDRAPRASRVENSTPGAPWSPRRRLDRSRLCAIDVSSRDGCSSRIEVTPKACRADEVARLGHRGRSVRGGDARRGRRLLPAPRRRQARSTGDLLVLAFLRLCSAFGGRDEEKPSATASIVRGGTKAREGAYREAPALRRGGERAAAPPQRAPGAPDFLWVRRSAAGTAGEVCGGRMPAEEDLLSGDACAHHLEDDAAASTRVRAEVLELRAPRTARRARASAVHVRGQRRTHPRRAPGAGGRPPRAEPWPRRPAGRAASRSPPNSPARRGARCA